MTNEEKAKEIASYWLDESDYNVARDAASEMAEWKDEQFKSFLKLIYAKTLSIEKDVVIEQLLKQFGEEIDRNEFNKEELKELFKKLKEIEL